MAAPVLETRGIHKAFGALVVAREINFSLNAGDRHAMKRELAAHHATNRDAYTQGKDAFIRGVLARSGWRPEA